MEKSMNYLSTSSRTTRQRLGGHVSSVVGVQTDSRGMRRRIMAALRMSSMCVVFGKQSKVGALGFGRNR